MLILQRKVGEKVYLMLPSGERIVVTVSSVRGAGSVAKVRLGFDAPQSVTICRPENLWWYDVIKRDEKK